MAKGVRVGTGYIEITAEVTEVTKKVRSALDEVSGYGAGAGAKIGKELSGGIYKGIDAKATATKIVKDLTTGISPTSAGTQIGKELSVAIVKGVDAKGAGQKAGKDIATGVKESHSALRDALKEPFDDAKKDIQNWGHEVAREIRSGDIQGAASDVGSAVNNITNGIYNLGTAVGIHLDAVKGFGSGVVNVLNTVGTKGQTVADDLKKIPESLKLIHEGGTAGKIQGVADATALLAKAAKDVGINLGDTPDKIMNIAGAATGIASVGAEIAKWGKMMPASGSVLWVLAVLFGATASAAPGQLGRTNEQEYKARQAALEAYQKAHPGAKIPEGFAKWIQPPERPGGPIGRGAPMPPELAPYYQAPSQTIPGMAQTQPGKPKDWWGTSGPTAAPSSSTTPNQEGLLPVTSTVRSNMNARFPGHTIGGFRQDQNYPNEHPAGKALDFMIGNLDEGYQALPFALSQPGVKYVIFNGQMWYPDGRTEPYKGPNPHTDHLHIHTEPGEVRTYDDGGVLPPGTSLAVNNTGQPEIVLPPNTNTAGTVGQSPNQLGWQGAAQTGMDVIDFLRTGGFIPTGAGSQAVAGTSFIAGLLNLGNEAVAGLIDTGAQAATMAISMAASAAAAGGSMGSAGPAAGAAGSVAGELAGIPIQIAAEEAKRAVSWGFQMAAIGADALVEQLFPLGAPRWIGYDYTAFFPHVNVGAIGTTTVEKMMGLAQQQIQQGAGGPQTPGNLQQPGGPVSPQMLPGMQPVGAPVPRLGPPSPQAPPSVAGPEAAAPMAGPAGPPPPAAPPPPPPVAPPPPSPLNPADLLHQGIVGTADEGGWFMPNTIAANTTNRPELVLSPTQLDSMAATTTKPRHAGDTYYITAVDAEDVAKQIDKRKALAAMRYMGRP